ncbi:hypothetical protein Adu01nite_90610 [Paractinoplanes durhamensis]|uniref:Transposase IS4-like domain-containing protein n=1 Tax=Paractinoplanes durhamensis TaxID=113563 RepID=A0ABQ3ZD27_9ACTN|nr:hypothetical protein Adu01nite_90610 [Actinoplanes durhamensis]
MTDGRPESRFDMSFPRFGGPDDLPRVPWSRFCARGCAGRGVRRGGRSYRWSPETVALHQLVAVAGRRWSIEESFQATKTGLGLDRHQHRRWRAWHRWTTLVIAAHAFLAAATTAGTDSPDGLIDITVNELRPHRTLKRISCRSRK